MVKWTAANIPDLTGRVAIVTGANSGIGWEAALELARHGAHTILGCRDATRAQGALDRIRAAHPSANVEVSSLDLASLASIRSFTQRFNERFKKLDLLVNNAGVMAIPRRETADGFEMQLGTNYLGHFALTGSLLEPLAAAGNARVVTVASLVHWFGRIWFEDLQLKNHYGDWRAYCQSKLANLLFMNELQRRFAASGAPIISVGCHPGYASTNLQLVGPQLTKSSLGETIMSVGNSLVAQSAAGGALPTLYAATAPQAQAGQYYGPRFFGMWGAPVRARMSRGAKDPKVARELWEQSVKLTGVEHALLKRAA